MSRQLSLKERLFKPTTVEAVMKLPEYQYAPWRQNLAGIARILQSHMEHPQRLVVRIPILTVAPDNTDVRYGHYAELREQTPDEKPKTPFELFLEHFPFSWKEEPPIGTKVKVPGTSATFSYIPFIEQLERGLLTWYDRHKYPRETPDGLTERIDAEVQRIPILERGELEGRLALNGAHFFARVPSRSTQTPHAGAVYHVPYVDDGPIGTVWRRLRWRTGSIYNQVLGAGLPSAEQMAVFGEGEPVTAEQLAQLDKIARYCENHGNLVPRKWSPIIRFPRSVFSMVANMHRVVMWLPGKKEEPRLLYKPEMSALFGYALRNNNEKPYAIVQPFTREERLAFGRFGYVKG